MKITTKQLLWGLLALALLLRLFNLNHVWFGDETYWPELVRYQFEKGFSFKHVTPEGVKFIGDPPLTSLIYIVFGYLFGFEVWSVRLFSAFIGMLNIYLTFSIARKLFSYKTAIYSVGLMALSYWHLFESNIVERDGSFLLLFSLLTIFLYLRYRETKKSSWLIASGFLAGAALLIKVSALIITAVLLIWIFYDLKIFKKLRFWKYKLKDYSPFLFELAPYILFSVAIYGAFLAIAYWFIPEYYATMLEHAAPLAFFKTSWLMPVFREFVYLALWGSPLLIGLALLAILDFDKKSVRAIVWLAVPVLAYSHTVYGGGLDRYLSIIIPPLCMLSGRALEQHMVSKKHWLWFGGLAALYVAFLNILSTRQHAYITHNIASYVQNAIQLRWQFLFPYYGAGGPHFTVPFTVIGFSIIIASALFLCCWYMLKKHKTLFMPFLVLFLAVSGGFTLFITQEFLFMVHSPDITHVSYELIDYYREKEYSGLLWSTPGLSEHLKKPFEETIYLTGAVVRKHFDEYNQTLHEQGGIVLFRDFPKLAEDGARKKLISQCELIHTVSDKGLQLGFVYDCNHENSNNN